MFCPWTGGVFTGRTEIFFRTGLPENQFPLRPPHARHAARHQGPNEVFGPLAAGFWACQGQNGVPEPLVTGFFACQGQNGTSLPLAEKSRRGIIFRKGRGWRHLRPGASDGSAGRWPCSRNARFWQVPSYVRAEAFPGGSFRTCPWRSDAR